MVNYFDVELGEADAHSLWRAVLARQGMSDRRRLSSVIDVADRALGLHAARVHSPYVTAATRTSLGTDLSVLTHWQHGPLLTVRCMRKTLHTLPLGLAQHAHLATLQFRVRDTWRRILNAGEDQGAVERAAAAIHVHLSRHRYLSPRAVEHAMRPTHNTVCTRLALKLLWERGEIGYRNIAPQWYREDRVFFVSRDPKFYSSTPADRLDATNELLTAYFERYGPATVLDAARWSGLSQRAVMAALALVPTVKLRLPWASSLFFMTKVAWAAWLDDHDRQQSVGVTLAAHEDVALKAYWESRARYLAATELKSVFNSIGEALPTVLDDGRAIGRWAWDHQRQEVTLIDVSSEAADRPDIKQVVQEMSAKLRPSSSQP